MVALSDSDGDSCQSYEYSAYGQVAASDPNFLTNPYMFTGRRFDIETGLYYYRARYYNPHIGRFMQTDPVGYSDGINWYLYCRNNPIIRIDIGGLWSSLRFTWYDDQALHLVVSLMNSEGPEDTYLFTDWDEYFDYIRTYGYFYNLEVDKEDVTWEFTNPEDFAYECDVEDLSTWQGIVIVAGAAAHSTWEATEGYRMVAGTFAIAIGGDVFKSGLASQNYLAAGIGIGLVAGGSVLVITDPVAWEIWNKAHNIWEEAGLNDYVEQLEEDMDETGY